MEKNEEQEKEDNGNLYVEEEAVELEDDVLEEISNASFSPSSSFSNF